MAAQALVVLTTLGSEEEARQLVRGLVESRLVACGTLVPGATSVYRWEGALVEEREVLVLLKTDAARWGELVAAVNARHPYQVPEFLALPVERGLERYLSWMASEVGGGGRV
jgi:periplasmic divalent cation tolerance protein